MKPKFTLLVTGGRELRHHKGLFPTTAGTVFTSLSYTPPYESFEELRKLCRRIRAAERDHTVDTLAIDLTQWIGHTDEDFFTVACKYFHDHTDYRYRFTVEGWDSDRVLPLFAKLRAYLPGRLRRDPTFDSPRYLADYLHTLCPFDREGADALSLLILRKASLHSYDLLGQLAEELKELSGNGIVSHRTIKRYLADPDSILALHLGPTPQPIPTEHRRIFHEKEAV